MIRLRLILTLFICAAISACNSAPTCDELLFYEYAEGGRRISPPDDLDPLDEGKEMIIPEASPRPPRDLNAGCIDKPPTIQDLARQSDDETET